MKKYGNERALRQYLIDAILFNPSDADQISNQIIDGLGTDSDVTVREIISNYAREAKDQQNGLVTVV